jgi:hypothetical protein
MSYSIQSLLGTLPLNEIARRADIINRQFLIGHNNITVAKEGGGTTITFTANAATTTITFGVNYLSASSVLSLTPTTANAAAAMNTWYESSRSVANGTITLTHANNVQIDRIFRYTLNG